MSAVDNTQAVLLTHVRSLGFDPEVGCSGEILVHHKDVLLAKIIVDDRLLRVLLCSDELCSRHANKLTDNVATIARVNPQVLGFLTSLLTQEPAWDPNR